MVVIVIIGVLAALIAPEGPRARRRRPRSPPRSTDVSNLMNALKLYRLDNGRYPSERPGPRRRWWPSPPPAAIPGNWKGYLDKLPDDPWQHPYQYANPGVHGEIDVFSFGADGQPGGEGDDADIGSWQ